MNNLIETYNTLLEDDIELYFYYINIWTDNNDLIKMITNDFNIKSDKSYHYNRHLDHLISKENVVIDEDNIWTDEYAKKVAMRYKKIYKMDVVVQRCDIDYVGSKTIFSISWKDH